MQSALNLRPADRWQAENRLESSVSLCANARLSMLVFTRVEVFYWKIIIKKGARVQAKCMASPRRGFNWTILWAPRRAFNCLQGGILSVETSSPTIVYVVPGETCFLLLQNSFLLFSSFLWRKHYSSIAIVASLFIIQNKSFFFVRRRRFLDWLQKTTKTIPLPAVHFFRVGIAVTLPRCGCMINSMWMLIHLHFASGC